MEIQERRRYFRIKLITKVTLVQDERFHYFYSRDLSVGGVFLETEEPYAIGTELKMEIPLPEVAERIKVKGKVVRRVLPAERQKGNIPGMGVHFTDMSPENQAMLADFIAREMAQE